MNHNADIGIFGGSGFYSFFDDIKEITIDTPYGATSDSISLANFEGKTIAFMPRHGKNHQYSPDTIPYRANIYAMKKLGVSKIIAPTASGSLKAEIKPGDFVVCDQFVNLTWGRNDTYYDCSKINNDYIDTSIVNHVSPAYPYCKNLRLVAIESARKLNINIHENGTVVVIQGPRFSTCAESRLYSNNGWDVINMTQYPECYLAIEMGICYVNISLITDYDAGLEGNPSIIPVTHEEVIKVFNENNDKVKSLLFEIIRNIDLNSDCCYKK